MSDIRSPNGGRKVYDGAEDSVKQNNHGILTVFFAIRPKPNKVETMAEAAATQEWTPEQKRVFNEKLREWQAKRLEEDIERYQKATYIVVKGKKIRKTLTQRIPWTKEERKKELDSYIDKVFFEDGALQMPMPKEKKGNKPERNKTTAGQLHR